MMKKQLLRGLIVGALAAAGAGLSPLAQADVAGTPSLDLTVNAEIKAGTCSAAVYDRSGNPTNIINLGEVYLSEIAAVKDLSKPGGKVEPFTLRFSDCAGLQERTATVFLAPPAPPSGCAGGNSNLPAFANTAQTSKADKTALEVWTTNVPGSSGSVQLQCYTKNKVTVDLSDASATKSVDLPLSARLVPVTQTSVMTPGDFIAPTVFTIAYQ